MFIISCENGCCEKGLVGQRLVIHCFGSDSTHWIMNEAMTFEFKGILGGVTFILTKNSESPFLL